MILFVPVALAGWTPNGSENGCTFFLGDVEGKVQPVRAECDWPIAADELHRLIAATGDHDLYFSAVESCDVIGKSGDKEVATQVHVASGISDREVVLLFGKEPLPGGMRYTWTKSPDQTAAKRGLVPVAVDTGKWEITSTPGGSHVVYELRYDAGGSVPGFLVRWFQGSGLKTLIGELRTWAETH
ncbi:MAG: hypothetical protein ACOZNI_13445 [Myxococcota bacterium]